MKYYFNWFLKHTQDQKDSKQLEIKAQQFYALKLKIKNQKIIINVWEELRLLRSYKMAREFRAFILQKTTIKSLVLNIKIQQQNRIRIKEQNDKINYHIKRKYFRYLLKLHQDNAKYIKNGRVCFKA